MRTGQIFFSYSRKDAKFALKLGEDMRKAGIDIWIDQIDIPASEPWDEEIQKALQESDCLLVILSQTSVASDNVLNEINYALESKKQVLPILLENNIKKPINIGRLQHIDFTGSYEDAFNRLLRSLDVKETSPVKKTIINRMTIGISALAIIILASAIVILNGSKKDNVDSSDLNRETVAESTTTLPAETLSDKVTGEWSSAELTNPYFVEDKYKLYFEFEVLGDVVVGSLRKAATAKNHSYDVKKAIQDGKIRNNIISFYVTEQQILGSETETYKDFYVGSLSNDEIRFSVQSDRSNGFEGLKFLVRRSAPVKK